MQKIKPSSSPPPPTPLFVSICTPTYNRRPFIEQMFNNFNRQTYPKEQMEWIIVDDGTDKIDDLICNKENSSPPQIRYFRIDKKMSLGEKRNYMHQQCRGEIIIYMDDDDYYPPERVSHAVEMLQKNPDKLCAGASHIFMYFNDLRKMVECGPYNPNHATAGTFAFRRKMLEITKYDDTACLAEEAHFLKNWTIPLVQLDTQKTILVFPHEHNSFDKHRLLESMNPQVCKYSNKSPTDFIVGDNTALDFYTNKLNYVLKDYPAGLPENKQDVVKYTEKLNGEMAAKQFNMMVATVQQLQQENQQLQQKIDEQTATIRDLKKENIKLKIDIYKNSTAATKKAASPQQLPTKYVLFNPEIMQQNLGD